jgi:hypothetical protein
VGHDGGDGEVDPALRVLRLLHDAGATGVAQHGARDVPGEALVAVVGPGSGCGRPIVELQVRRHLLGVAKTLHLDGEHCSHTVRVVPDLPIPEMVENRRRSIAMLPSGTPALDRDEALQLLDQLEAALLELRKLRTRGEVQ